MRFNQVPLFDASLGRIDAVITAIAFLGTACCGLYLGSFSCGNYLSVLNGVYGFGISLVIVTVFVRASVAARMKSDKPLLRQFMFIFFAISIAVISHAVGWMIYAGFNTDEFIFGLANFSCG